MQAPVLPEGVTGAELDADVQAELRSLTKANADDVGAHLAATALLLDEDPEAAYKHASYAKARASRVGSVREAVGIAAYMTGRFAEALSELRAVKRIHGSDVHLPVMADCQRGLGRPERALEMAGSPEAAALDAAGQVEMRIVAAGARQDLGQYDAAVLTLQCAQLRDAKAEWAPRLRYAYAEALLAAGRADEGRDWMTRAVEADTDAVTDAAERLAELEGVTFFESADDDDTEAGGQAGEPRTTGGAPVVDASPTGGTPAAEPSDGTPPDTGSRGPATVPSPVVAAPAAVPEVPDVAGTPAVPEVIFTEAPSAPDEDPDAHPTLF